MAFGNPYGDPWDSQKLHATVAKIADLGIRSISLADTVGLAAPLVISRVVKSVLSKTANCEIGLHMHSRRNDAAAKVLAAYDAGCRRIDSALGGLGGCPFAQDALVGNIPTEIMIEALRERGVESPVAESLAHPLAMNLAIASEYS
jgi:hydroxymethylglutaryl-CoA lyase